MHVEPRSKGAPLYLVGDSNAWHFAEAAIGAAEQLQRPIWIFTTPSCPLIQKLEITPQGRSPFFPGPWPPREFAHCPNYVEYTLGWLGHAQPGTVMIAALDQYWWDSTLGLSIRGSEIITDSAAKASVLREGLVTTVKRLSAAGHNVILIQSIPTFRKPLPIWDPRACTPLALTRGTCHRELLTTDVETLQSTSRAAIEQAAQLTGSTIIDLRHWFCPNTTCNTYRDGSWLYMDATHITVATSRALAPEFERAIRALPPK